MRSLLKARARGPAIGLVLAIGFAAAAAAPRSAPLLKDQEFFFRGNDGTILTLLTLEFLAAGGGDSGWVVAASVKEADRRGQGLPGAKAWTVPLETAPPPSHQGRTAFVGRIELRSGHNYAVRYVLRNGSDDEIILKNAFIVVPYLNGGFSASSVVPAEQFGPATSSAGPFQVGSEDVLPKPGGLFKRSEFLRLYLQVYDAVIDPATSLGRVDVEFRFYRLVNGRSKRHGKIELLRDVAGVSAGLTLPIADWPPGSYRVVAELFDRRSAARTSTEGSFSIVED